MNRLQKQQATKNDPLKGQIVIVFPEIFQLECTWIMWPSSELESSTCRGQLLVRGMTIIPNNGQIEWRLNLLYFIRWTGIQYYYSRQEINGRTETRMSTREGGAVTPLHTTTAGDYVKGCIICIRHPSHHPSSVVWNKLNFCHSNIGWTETPTQLQKFNRVTFGTFRKKSYVADILFPTREEVQHWPQNRIISATNQTQTNLPNGTGVLFSF